MRLTSVTFLLLSLCTFTSSRAAENYPVSPVPFTSVRLTGGFWLQKQETNRVVTVPFALKQCEESGRLKNFQLAAEVMHRRANGEPHFQIKPPTIFPFDDTDVYKAIEGASYVLSMKRDEALERKLDEWIAIVAAAQEPDGYLYTFRTMHPDSPGHPWIGQQRWEQDPFLSHELYNAGHLYEAGVAHFQATGKRTLLDVCLKNAELLWHDFGDDRPIVAPGHQIVEMGLVKLYSVSHDKRYLTLAQKFLDARGPRGPQYNQRHKRVVDQDEAVGHAVRANYMYSGMADVAALTGDERYVTAIQRIWQNVVEKKLYLTGGVGALEHGEAYGGDYDLPDDGYNETCAAVALMMWNHRMFLLSGDAKYMDVFERTAYNGFLSGVSTSGDCFFYPNPLAYDGKKKNNHGFAGRAPWFGCACCPPNLMRTLASLTGYFYAVRDTSLFINLYGDNEADVNIGGTAVKLSQSTDYPWDGAIKIKVTPAKPTKFTARVRIPEWAQGQPLPSDLYAYEKSATPASWSVAVNGEVLSKPDIENGYVSIKREWSGSDSIELKFAMPVQRVRGNDFLFGSHERVAFERGPIVYCFERDEDAKTLGRLTVTDSAKIAARFDEKLLGGVTALDISGAEFSADSKHRRQEQDVVAIPYFAWNNRGLKPMTVWVRSVPLPPDTAAD
ncbi:MAG TPA: beta-L-arabinofuranosidase domain-containing protein [Opitutaceae bacterium]|nr:beta-L-arabinofuranosidase domain-containing protein [Opitutaceae bacterium]